MAHPIFVSFNGTPEELRATGIGGYGRWEAYSLGHFEIAVVHADHPSARADISKLHPDMIVLPGPGGNLNQRQLTHLCKHWPTMKEGDAFRTVLLAIHAMLPVPICDFDPDCY
jgi:hypothetical protein